MLVKKIEVLQALMRADDWPAAIKFAAKFPRLGDEKTDITRAKDALLRPGFYRQIGRDPAALIERGKAALILRYPSR